MHESTSFPFPSSTAPALAQATAHDRFHHVAPLGTSDIERKWEGRAEKKPWEYPVTAIIPHLDTIECLKVVIALLRLQTVRPYILVMDTGSPPDVRAELEALRCEDIEIHFTLGHGYRHSSEPVCIALDHAHSLCRTEFAFHTHTDCFPRRRDFLESVMRMCNANTPAIGYRMSPRDWATKEWEWMVGHSALMLYMASIERAGATWSYQRIVHQYGYAWQTHAGWPDTEVGFNHGLRDAGIKPVFIGYDRNFERQIDDNIDHCRSHAGSRVYSPEVYAKVKEWMVSALADARERITEWSLQKGRDALNG
jgi:hypothetical protein